MKEFFNYLEKLNALEDVPFDLDSQWESKPKNEGKRIVKKSAKLNENYGHDGYMYITKHGLGPGTLPKDAHLLKWKDLPHYMTAIWLDRFLTTDELNQYDIYPETQIRTIMDRYDITEDDIMGESVKTKRKSGRKALTEADSGTSKYEVFDVEYADIKDPENIPARPPIIHASSNGIIEIPNNIPRANLRKYLIKNFEQLSYYDMDNLDKLDILDNGNTIIGYGSEEASLDKPLYALKCIENKGDYNTPSTWEVFECINDVETCELTSDVAGWMFAWEPVNYKKIGEIKLLYGGPGDSFWRRDGKINMLPAIRDKIDLDLLDYVDNDDIWIGYYPDSMIIYDGTIIKFLYPYFKLEKVSSDAPKNESVKIKHKSGRKTLKEELSDIKQEWEDFLSDGGNNVIEFDDGDYVSFGVDFDKGTIYAGSATNTGIIREYEINLDSDLNLDENIAELYDEICREKEQENDAWYEAHKEDIENAWEEQAISDVQSELDAERLGESVKSKRKSNLKESKRLVEGPGAGYTIEGQLSDIQIHDFTFSVNDDIVTVNCNIDAISKDTEAHSYYYGDVIGKVPVTISKVQYYIYDDASSITEDAVREDLKYYLDGIKYEAIVGGGWSHTTFDGNITAKMFRHYNGADSDVIYLEMDCTDEGDILYIDDVVTGEYEREDEEDYIDESLEDSGLTKTTLKAIKKGTYFTFKPVEDPSENLVYVKDDYDRESRKYGYYKWSDTNNWHEKKGDTVVYTGFTF